MRRSLRYHHALVLFRNQQGVLEGAAGRRLNSFIKRTIRHTPSQVLLLLARIQMSFHARRGASEFRAMANNNAITPGQRRLCSVLLNGKNSSHIAKAERKRGTDLGERDGCRSLPQTYVCWHANYTNTFNTEALRKKQT